MQQQRLGGLFRARGQDLRNKQQGKGIRGRRRARDPEANWTAHAHREPLTGLSGSPLLLSLLVPTCSHWGPVVLMNFAASSQLAPSMLSVKEIELGLVMRDRRMYPRGFSVTGSRRLIASNRVATGTQWGGYLKRACARKGSAKAFSHPAGTPSLSAPPPSPALRILPSPQQSPISHPSHFPSRMESSASLTTSSSSTRSLVLL